MRPYSSRNHISERMLKSCDKCNQRITFAKNSSGKWLCVDAHSLDNGQTWFWRRNGNNNNFIPTHQCTSLVEVRRIRLEAQARGLVGRIGQCMLKACNPMNQELIDRLYQTHVMAVKRLERRMAK
jgi:hypothetical protein